MTDVKYVRWGLARRIDDVVFLNENLLRPEWSFLHDYLLEHELGHSNAATSVKDVVHDLKDATRSWLGWEIMFMMKHPRAWTQVLGVSWYRESPTERPVIGIDWTNILINVFVFSVLFFGTKWIGRIIGWW
jgi:hypothetical protein